MIINLGDNFESYDFVKVSANGRNIENIKTVEFTFNKEGLIGFAKNLVWLYEDMDVNKKFYVSTDPLGGVPSGNQVIGFYLTADSPILVFKVNSLFLCNSLKRVNKVNVRKKTKMKKLINILPPTDDSYMEEYELGYRNLGRILLYDDKDKNITNKYYEIFLEINYEGLKNLAIFLLKIADAYHEGDEYYLNLADGGICNFGIVLTDDSLPVRFKCSNLGRITDYEPKFE